MAVGSSPTRPTTSGRPCSLAVASSPGRSSLYCGGDPRRPHVAVGPDPAWFALWCIGSTALWPTLFACCRKLAGSVVIILRGRPPQTPRCGGSRPSVVRIVVQLAHAQPVRWPSATFPVSRLVVGGDPHTPTVRSVLDPAWSGCMVVCDHVGSLLWFVCWCVRSTTPGQRWLRFSPGPRGGVGASGGRGRGVLPRLCRRGFLLPGARWRAPVRSRASSVPGSNGRSGRR